MLLYPQELGSVFNLKGNRMSARLPQEEEAQEEEGLVVWAVERSAEKIRRIKTLERRVKGQL